MADRRAFPWRDQWLVIFLAVVVAIQSGFYLSVLWYNATHPMQMIEACPAPKERKP